MTKPKEALEYMLDCFRDGIGSADNQAEAIADAEAAIPKAELHQQAVETLDHIMALGLCKSGVHKYAAQKILTQLKALKCTPQK